jgi:hypothetical protein
MFRPHWAIIRCPAAKALPLTKNNNTEEENYIRKINRTHKNREEPGRHTRNASYEKENLD